MLNVPAICLIVVGALLCPAGVSAAAQNTSTASETPAAKKAQPSRHRPQQAAKDHSGKVKKGKASYYGKRFAGKPMASGKPMKPESNIAASKTLPLGTKARVTNLKTGKSAVVEIEDRGPYVEGRIIDLTPKTAEKLEMRKDGVAPVEVAPIEVPQPDGSVKPGEGAKAPPARNKAR